MFDSKQIRVVHFEPTTICQLECPQCARFDAQGAFNHNINPVNITLAEFKQLLSVEFLRQLDKFYMCGTFGEPTVNYDCLEMFKYVRSANIAITLGLNTNGSTRSSKWWSELAQLFCQARDYVVFSIDGLEDTNHIYRKKSSWRRIMNNAEAFIDAGGSAHWDMIVFEHNEHQVDQARELARDMGFTWFRVKRSQRHEYKNISWIQPPRILAAPAPRSQQIQCEAVTKSEVYVSAHGTLFPCCHIGEQWFADSRPENRQELMERFGDIKQYQVTHGVDAVVKKWDWIQDTWQDQPMLTCQQSCGSRPKQHQWIEEYQLR